MKKTFPVVLSAWFGACWMTQGIASNSWSAYPPASSVYHVNVAVDASVIAGTALGTLIPALYANQIIHPRCPCDPNEVNPFDRPVIGNSNPFLDSVSDVSAGAAVIAPILGDYLDVGASREFVEDMTVYAETLSVNGALVTLAKYTAQRPLPRVYAGQDPELISEPAGYRSFYSGHASLTFSALSASSVTLNLRHHAGVWPWIVTGVFGFGVAAERVAAGRHFYTDVIVGAAAGTLVGVVVPLLHKADSSKKPMTTARLRLMPIAGGAQLLWMKDL